MTFDLKIKNSNSQWFYKGLGGNLWCTQLKLTTVKTEITNSVDLLGIYIWIIN